MFCMQLLGDHIDQLLGDIIGGIILKVIFKVGKSGLANFPIIISSNEVLHKCIASYIFSGVKTSVS